MFRVRAKALLFPFILCLLLLAPASYAQEDRTEDSADFDPASTPSALHGSFCSHRCTVYTTSTCSISCPVGIGAHCFQVVGANTCEAKCVCR